jgi:acyl-CoA reductase-like NAD-dependent aldehyde dehydrogenase
MTIAVRIEERARYRPKDRPKIVAAARRLEERLNALAADEQAEVLARISAALEEPATADAHAGLVDVLTGGRRYTAEERAALESAVLARSFARRRELLAGAKTATEVAALLGTSRQTPHDRLQSGTLIAVYDNGAWRFPVWQFDPEGPDGVIAGLPAVIRALRVPPLVKVSWLTRPSPYLDGATPLDALKRGEVERVVAQARGVGAD